MAAAAISASMVGSQPIAAAQFNGFQTEPKVNRDDTLKQRQMILPLLLECLIALLGFQPCPEL
jgi:hypothetical protein